MSFSKNISFLLVRRRPGKNGTFRADYLPYFKTILKKTVILVSAYSFESERKSRPLSSGEEYAVTSILVFEKKSVEFCPPRTTAAAAADVSWSGRVSLCSTPWDLCASRTNGLPRVGAPVVVGARLRFHGSNVPLEAEQSAKIQRHISRCARQKRGSGAARAPPAFDPAAPPASAARRSSHASCSSPSCEQQAALCSSSALSSRW